MPHTYKPNTIDTATSLSQNPPVVFIDTINYPTLLIYSLEFEQVLVERVVCGGPRAL